MARIPFPAQSDPPLDRLPAPLNTLRMLSHVSAAPATDLGRALLGATTPTSRLLPDTPERHGGETGAPDHDRADAREPGGGVGSITLRPASLRLSRGATVRSDGTLVLSWELA